MSPLFKEGGNYMPMKSTNDFPFVDRVNTKSTVTNFNYSLWGDNTNIKLCNVNWNSDYDNVVKFEDDNERDSYFNNLDGYNFEINSTVRIENNGFVRLNIPFDEAVNFNYLVASYEDMPIPKVTNKSKLKYYYFIDDILYISPNTTELILKLDVWTTYINDMEVTHLNLERGHSPMLDTTVDDFLENPLENHTNLLEKDVDTGDLFKISWEKYLPFQTDEPYMLIATSSNPKSANWDDNVPALRGNITSSIPNGIYIFAVKADKYLEFISNADTQAPQFIQTIQALYYLDSKFINLGSQFNFMGVDCWDVGNGQPIIGGIELSKEMFNYPEEYEWITKLYTTPYSILEVTDNNGKFVEIAIQNTTGDLEVRANASIAFPALNLKAFITGIGGSGENSYVIKKFTGEETIDMFKDDWHKYSFDIEIPIYGIYQGNRTNFDYNNKYAIEQEINNINLSKTISDRNNNLTKELATRSNMLTGIMVGKDNIHRSAMKDIDHLDIDLATKINVVSNNRNYSLSRYLDWFKRASVQQMIPWEWGHGMWEISPIDSDINPVSAGLTIGGNVATGNYLSAGLHAANMMANGFFSSMQKQNTLIFMHGLKDDSPAPEIGGHINDSLASNIAWMENQNGFASFPHKYANLYMLHKMDNAVITSNRKDTEITRHNNDVESDRYTYESENITTKHNVATSNVNDQKSNSLEAIENRKKQANLGNQHASGRWSGTTGWMDSLGLRGIDFKVKTLSKDKLKEVANTFLRFGYMCNNTIDFTGFNLMKHFTYWKVNEVWLKSNNSNQHVRNTITNILEKGVTIWNNPDDIGCVDIKDNVIL